MPLRAIGLWLLIIASTVRADESFRLLKVKDAAYTNVTVTTVTATDIYFTHSQGISSAKLKDLDPELQKHFHFDAAKSSQVEEAQTQATADFRTRLALQKPAAPPTPPTVKPDYVVPQLYARSIRGQPAPQLQIEKWITDRPSTDGKFMLVEFWATSSGPCQELIPRLNAFQKEFDDRLVIIGLTDESDDAPIRHLTTADFAAGTPPQIEYSVAVDTQARMAQELDIKALPHSILIDTTGVVRFEGDPRYLSPQVVKNILDKYSP
jgi:cytochrome c biogenesis protein CcmG, thiol:disulfide interchange protein DsbE